MRASVPITLLAAALSLPGCAVFERPNSHVGLAVYPYQGRVSEIHSGFARDLRAELKIRDISCSGMGYGHMFLSVEEKRAREARRVARRIRQSYARQFPGHSGEIEQIEIYRWNGKKS